MINLKESAFKPLHPYSCILKENKDFRISDACNSLLWITTVNPVALREQALRSIIFILRDFPIVCMVLDIIKATKEQLNNVLTDMTA